MNAMLVYVMAAEGIFAGFINGWYYDSPHNSLVHISDLILYFLCFSCTLTHIYGLLRPKREASHTLVMGVPEVDIYILNYSM